MIDEFRNDPYQFDDEIEQQIFLDNLNNEDLIDLFEEKFLSKQQLIDYLDYYYAQKEKQSSL